MMSKFTRECDVEVLIYAYYIYYFYVYYIMFISVSIAYWGNTIQFDGNDTFWRMCIVQDNSSGFLS